MELCKRIRNRREELNMSQEELAKRIGYKSRSSINKIEMGENDIPHSKIEAFANALNTTPAYLLGLEENFSVKIDLPASHNHCDNQRVLLEYFNRLNALGKKEAIKRIEELTLLPKYNENTKAPQ